VIRIYRFIALLIFFSLFLAIKNSYAEYFTIKNYNVDLTVKNNSVIEVKEEISVSFTEQRHGIFRKIPYIYKTSDKGKDIADRPFTLNKNFRYDIFDVNVPNENYKVYKEGRYLIIRIGDADKYVSGDKKYTIYYKIYGGVNFFQSHSELYWNIIGTEWDVPIERFEVFLFFPSPLNITEDDFFIYTGRYGSTASDVSYNFDGQTLVIKSLSALNPGEGLTVGVKMPKDYLTKGSVSLNVWLFLINNVVFLIPIVVFVVFFMIWWVWGRDDSYVKMVYYKPPPDIDPAEAGVVIDDIIDNRDLISLIFYWAANGYIEIEQVEDTTAIIFKKVDYILTKLKDLPDDAKSYEKVIFSGLFPPYTSSCRISTLKNQFYETMNVARAYLDQEIESLQLYTSSRTYGKLFSGLAIISAFISFFAGITLKRLDLFISLAISSAIIFFFSRIMPKKTSEGLKIYKMLEGFKDFIERVDKVRLKMLLKEDPTYFDKTLPYAISLGVADKWAEKFEGLLSQPPDWYKGYHYERFSTAAFVSSINSSISDINSAFTSTPQSAGSGSSGFSSGGGFSGGGGGGGGGGSW